ncbi:MAG: ferredoxin-like protein [Dehalococcoidales bacterium]|nr:ferredoxin-like protein [Dehalococcoidales bacterium]
MHHTLKLYDRHRQGILRVYMFFAAWTKIPLLGRLVRWVANMYGKNLHGVYLLTPEEAEELVSIAEGVARAPCTCRTIYKNCDNPRDNEILLGPTEHILREQMPDDSREITREEAAEILRDSHRRGLILSIAKCRGDFYAICSCCSCCCVPLRMSKQYGIGEALVRHKDIVAEFRRYQAELMAAEHV